MTDRQGHDRFSVAPQRLGDGPRGTGRRALAVAAVVAVACVVLGIGWFGPRQTSRPSPDTGRAVTPTPAAFTLPPGLLTTPLPALTGGDPARLSGTIGVVGDGFRILDLGNGATTSPLPQPGDDIWVPDPIGAGWLCICAVGGSPRDLDLVRVDGLGNRIDRRTIARLGASSEPDRSIAIQTEIDLAADGRTGLLAVVVQGGAGWTYSVAALDLVAGTLGPLVALGTQSTGRVLPSPVPSDASPTVSVFRPYVRLSPDGGRAVVWATLFADSRDGVGLADSVGWIIHLDRQGSPTTFEEATGLSRLPIHCALGGWLAANSFVGLCGGAGGGEVVPGPVAPLWSIRQIASDGRLTRRLDLPGYASYDTDMLFDTANAAIWAWTGTARHLRRIDAATGDVLETTFDPASTTAPGTVRVNGRTPVWARPEGVASQYWSQIAGSSDGTRLFLNAYSEPQSPGPPASDGILVVDPSTMALLGRWAPDAAYTSIRLGVGGSIVIASGMPGRDEGGDEVPWEASITFHDAEDGQILARYGRLGDSPAPIVIEP